MPDSKQSRPQADRPDRTEAFTMLFLVALYVLVAVLWGLSIPVPRDDVALAGTGAVRPSVSQDDRAVRPPLVRSNADGFSI